MTAAELVAQAVAVWLGDAVRSEADVAREALPAMDVPHFMRSLASIEGLVPKRYALVLAGFGTDEVRLRELARAANLEQLAGISDSLNVAAAWRNNRSNYPNIIALARGWHPGVSTLKHFERARSHDLVTALLDWALASGLFSSNAIQRELLEALKNSQALGNILSLESVTAFLSEWSGVRTRDANDAPRAALPHLGILADPSVFAHAGKLEARLVLNRDTTQRMIDTPASQIRALRKRLNSRYRNDLEARDRLLRTLEAVETIRLRPTVDRLVTVTLDDVVELWRPPADLPDNTDDDDEEHTDENESSETDTTWDLSDVATQAGESLLDNDQEKLTELLDALEGAVKEAICENRSDVQQEIEIEEQSLNLDFDLDLKFLDWLHQFCTTDRWGGIVDTREPTLGKALQQYASNKHDFVEIGRIATIDGRELSLKDLLADWERDLADRNFSTSLTRLFEEFERLRSEILADIDSLVQFPINWLGGRPEASRRVDRYLTVATSLYSEVQRHFRDVQEIDQGWAQAVLEGILALDVVQVRCQLDENRTSWKAVLLPTHPLHLWRYQRLVAVLRGLGSQLDADDRKAVLDQCRRPDQFLSVLFIGSLPGGRGGHRLLPIANDLNGLATFENLQNAYNGLDGLNTLSYALDRFAVTHRNHSTPLRVAVVNPPEATTLLSKLTKLLSDRRANTLPALRIELFSTPSPSVKMRAAKALEFSSKEQEVIEDRLTSGRLELQIHEEPAPIESLVTKFQAKPFHIVMIFDEAGVNIRKGAMGVPLPMSPFCVRKTIKYEARRNILTLIPTTDDPPFSEFMQLINEAESGQRDSTPHTWADAENLRRVVDDLLQGERPGAHWLAIADRALPSESGLASVRVLMRREGQRDVLLVSRDYRRLAQLVRPAFDQCNLTMSAQQLERLLEEGVNLVGAGLLDLIKQDGTADAKRVLGLAGMLLAARDYRRRHCDSLIVSVDQEIARLWLRLGKRPERCDLICLRMEAGRFVIEPLEVKTTFSAEVNGDPELITHAQQQLAATLEAVSQGLPDDQDSTVLAAPRCEMLKEVLVRGCLSRSVPAELRSQWSTWLKQLFRQEGEIPVVDLQGEVVRIAVGSNEAPFTRALAADPHPIRLRVLTESDVQQLIDLTVAESRSVAPPITSGAAAIASDTPIPETTTPEESSPVEAANDAVATINREAHVEPVDSSPVRVDADPERVPADWPPQVNAFGMIGQDEVVRQLIDQLQFARDFDRRFNDKLFVGSAGVGKSSLARAIARDLIAEDPIIFNGADLQKPKMLIERLQQFGKVPDNPQGRVTIGPSVMFIDEAHAIQSSVVTVLLGALDDARITTVDNVEYSFQDVVLLMATTDQGRLPEAFQSRPDKIVLRNYTLNELAGILWLHGRQELDGYDLPRDVCLEVAARTRARPRVAVRMLTNQMIPYFHAQAREPGAQPDKRRIGDRMTVDAVAEFFEARHIDANGLDDTARNFLKYLQRSGATAEDRLRQALGIANRNDFVEVDEYLMRLGLVTIRGGRALTPAGRSYLAAVTDLRNRISRHL